MIDSFYLFKISIDIFKIWVYTYYIKINKLKGVIKMTKSEAVELFLENNKSIEYGTKGRVLIITNEISNDIKKFFKGILHR